MIKEKEIEKIASLARLRVKKEEFENLKKDFLKILEFVEKLKEVKIEEKTDLSFFKLSENFRKDEEEAPDWFDFEKLLSQFPQKEGRFLKTKKILEK